METTFPLSWGRLGRQTVTPFISTPMETENLCSSSKTKAVSVERQNREVASSKPQSLADRLNSNLVKQSHSVATIAASYIWEKMTCHGVCKIHLQNQSPEHGTLYRELNVDPTSSHFSSPRFLFLLGL